MKITKFVHSCLLVETSDRVAIFDPGTYSTVNIDALERLDDIFVTHIHADHMDKQLIAKLVAKFPQVRITATAEIVDQLKASGLQASAEAPEGASLFASPHEHIRPYRPVEPPQEIGIHYLNTLSHPGDSHSFKETKAILALPVQAPWGSVVGAVRLGFELKPRYVIPIHDWHWNDEARKGVYEQLEQDFAERGITFIKAVNGEPFEIEV
ncbi:MAG TPA: MBL fold metallo-hydrolase [Candidatus Saccharimonadia bacterium]|nr:MBL fold metallo-hydrolase [Candidatus Saccharimonadia bacterium]